jgi:hypothetical protein
MELKHLPYHLTKNRMTYIAIIILTIIGIYIGVTYHKPIDYYYDKSMILVLAWTFRKALKRLQ